MMSWVEAENAVQERVRLGREERELVSRVHYPRPNAISDTILRLALRAAIEATDKGYSVTAAIAAGQIAVDEALARKS